MHPILHEMCFNLNLFGIAVYFTAPSLVIFENRVVNLIARKFEFATHFMRLEAINVRPCRTPFPPRRARPGLDPPGVCVRHEPPGPNSYARLRTPFSRDPLCRGGGLDMIRKEAWPFYRTSSGVRSCWVSKSLKDVKDFIEQDLSRGQTHCRSTSLIWTCPPIGPCSRAMPRAL